VWVFLNKKKYEASIVHVDDDFDFAIMKIDLMTPTYFRLSSSDKIARETKVAAYGFPGAARTPLSEDELIRDIGSRKMANHEKTIDRYFKPRDLEFSSSSGTVSRTVVEEVGRTWVEHNATINPGNSGGPLIDDDGIVLGINTLGAPKGTGIYWSLSPHQFKAEIQKHSPDSIWK
jgi:S1-C subfamily serine protease